MFFPESLIAQLFTLILPLTWGSVTKVLLYVLSALALYTMASSRGIRGAWLSWIPIANIWVLGSLSDQYRYVVRRQNTRRRILMVILRCVIAVLWGLIASVIVSAASQGMRISPYNPGYVISYVLTRGGIMAALLALCIGILELWFAIVRLMALYDVYRSCDPGNALLFLILNIVLPVTHPILLFLNRDKEAGMPPRKEEA